MANVYDTTLHQEVEVGTTATTVLPQDKKRSFLLLQNDSDTDMYLAFGRAAELNKGILLVSKGTLFLDLAILTASISAIHGGTGNKRLLLTVAN